MKRFLPLITAFALAVLFYSCQKDPFTPKLNEKLKEKLKKIIDFKKDSTKIPITCGTNVQFNLIDYYPNQFYMTYGNMQVKNDANNVYITLNSLIQYSFYFAEIKMSIGNLQHLQSMVPYYDYTVGPPTADSSQSFTTAVNSYTFTVPRSSIVDTCFNIFIWALEVKSDKSDFHYVWLQSNTKTVLNPNSTYINYCNQNCSIKHGDDEDDDDDNDNDNDNHQHGHDDHEHDHHHDH
ncbi:MAG: hypothetical protein ACJ748_08475 [Flavisolibacter sp.]